MVYGPDTEEAEIASKRYNLHSLTAFTNRTLSPQNTQQYPLILLLRSVLLGLGQAAGMSRSKDGWMAGWLAG